MVKAILTIFKVQIIRNPAVSLMALVISPDRFTVQFFWRYGLRVEKDGTIFSIKRSAAFRCFGSWGVNAFVKQSVRA